MSRNDLRPQRVVASFDSASVLHASIAAGLQHRDFPRLGASPALAAFVSLAGRLPWGFVRPLYARLGGSEAVPADRLGRVDMGRVAQSFAAAFPADDYPAVFIGSSNGAVAHAAVAMGAPWLPSTVLVPVKRVGDPGRPDLALEFGRRVAGPLLEANEDIVLHQMHDQAQDELMVARMAYFRVKWDRLPEPYERLLRRLGPGAPVILVDDGSRWPVTRVSDRHVFQVGAQGGLAPADYLAGSGVPQPDEEAPEAEWGITPQFCESVRRWCDRTGHPLIRIALDGPQAASAPVARAMRTWIAQRSGAADRLIVPSFILGDPWRTAIAGMVPFWTFFPVRTALDSLEDFLSGTEPFAEAHILVFQHGALSPGRASPEDFAAVVRRFGAVPHLVALRPERSPHDITSLARYDRALRAIPALPDPLIPLSIDELVSAFPNDTVTRCAVEN